MIVVVPYCASDADACLENLRLAERLGKADMDCLIVPEGVTSKDSAICDVATKVFNRVRTFPAATFTGPKKWPQPHNAIWQHTARYLAGLNQPWFWWEPDAIPLKAGWLKAIEDDYNRLGKPFMGFKVPGMGHLNGVAVYPPNIMRYSTDCFICRSAAWDVVLGQQIQSQMAHSELFQHVWTLDDYGEPKWEDGPAPTFPDEHTVSQIVRDKAVIFHRCKDGTLRDRINDRVRGGGILQRFFKAVTPVKVNFKLFGGFGDLIYQLCAVKAKGGGVVTVEPSDFKGGEGVRMNSEKFEAVRPLIAQQKYVSKVVFGKASLNCTDFSPFINSLQPGIYEYGKSSCQYACELAGIKDRVFDESWLTVDHPLTVANGPTVIHRSLRYHNYKFDWRRVRDINDGGAVFVGLPEEHAHFCHYVGWDIPYIKTSNLLEMARIIAGCRHFIGNQSVGYAIAEGLKKDCTLEVFPSRPDTLFFRNGVGHVWK